MWKAAVPTSSRPRARRGGNRQETNPGDGCWLFPDCFLLSALNRLRISSLEQGLQRRLAAKQIGLPWEQHVTQSTRVSRDLRELGAVRNERGLNLQLVGDSVTIAADAVLQFDLLVRE